MCRTVYVVLLSLTSYIGGTTVAIRNLIFCGVVD